MKASLNKKNFVITTVDQLGEYLATLDNNTHVEAWLFHTTGSSICLLKSNRHMFLMYLRNHEDAGFVSLGNKELFESVEYTLSNDQADEYPMAWCIDREWAYKALAYFFVNDGAMAPHITWIETK